MNNNQVLWLETQLDEVIQVNPPRFLKKGQIATYVAMDQLLPFCREIQSTTQKLFTGSGSRFSNGDTLLARITPCLENGKTAYVSVLGNVEVGHGSTEFIVLSGKEGATENLFVYYLALSPEFRAYAIKKMEGTSGRQRVPAETIKRKTIALPPLQKQRRIAEILGTLDDKIELNIWMNKTLEEMAATIFKSWFIDFEPFQNSEFIDSELGPIPRDWEIRTIGSIGTIVCGKTPPTSDLNNYGDDYLFITIPCMHGNVFIIETPKMLSEKGAQTQPKKELPPLSVCVSCIATPGLVSLTSRPSYTNQQINSIICDSKVSPFYVFMMMNNISKSIVTLGSGGTATLNLNKINFSKIKIIVPDDRVMWNFHKRVETIFKKILGNLRESRTLAQIRDNLLLKMLSGKIQVKVRSNG